MIIPYNDSKEDRDKITEEREKKLYQSFENMRKQIDEQIQTMNFSTVSEKVKRQQLEEIRHSLQNALQAHYNALESGLKNDMVNIGQSVLNESESFYKGLNMPIGMSITSFPVEIMNNVVNGSVYQEKWYLSRALWGDYTEKLDQINEVISNGIGLNLPSFEIAKQLEQYVDPSAMTPSKTIVTHCLQDPVTGKLYSKDYVKRHPEKDWTGFKEKDSKFRYGKVDYNAQRLARTLINHAYQQNVVHQAQANPFATGVRWDASGGERMCEICEERDGKIFPVDEVPLDHPNGMCTFSVVTPDMMEMSNVLADFVNGEPTEYDDKLYAWYNDRAVKPEQKPVKKEEKKERKTKAKSEAARATGEVKPKTKFDKDVNKWYNSQSDFKGLMQKIQSEFGSTQTDAVVAYYNKHVLGIGNVATINSKSASSRLDKIVQELKSTKVKFNQCKVLAKAEGSREAIRILSGGDMTGGSCASLALAYMGRRNGIDVVDYRGGQSREWFADKQNKVTLAEAIGAKLKFYDNTEGKKGFSYLKEANLEAGKEYLVGYARHMAVIRRTDEGFLQYLELQSPSSVNNTWQPINADKMEWRFGGEKTTNKSVYVYDFSDVDRDKFKDVLGYINTSTEEQQKGDKGSIK